MNLKLLNFAFDGSMLPALTEKKNQHWNSNYFEENTYVINMLQELKF